MRRNKRKAAPVHNLFQNTKLTRLEIHQHNRTKLLETQLQTLINDHPKDILYKATQSGLLEIVRITIDTNNIDPTLLYIAAEHNHLDIVTFLIDNNVNTDQPHQHGWTPLHIATQNNHLRIIETLVEHKANLHKKDNNGWTPLHVSACSNRPDATRLLLNKQANKDITNHRGQTPLYIAAQSGHGDVVHQLLEQNANPNKADPNGVTPLVIAAMNGHIDAVKLLVDKSNQHQTALFVAAQNGFPNIVELMLNKDVDKDIVISGSTPLNVATINGHIDVVRLLAKHRANPNKPDNNGYTPLQNAARWKRTRILNVLKKNQSFDASQQTKGRSRAQCFVHTKTSTTGCLSEK